MSFAADISTLRSPIVDNWDFSQTPVLWESEGEAPSELASGDRSAPGEFLVWRHEYAPGEYLAGGSNTVWKHADVDCRLCVEKVAGSRASAIMAARADSLTTYYGAASGQSVVFRTPEAYLTSEYEFGSAWLARDWVCPVWIFSPGPEDQLLAGESANQLQITQASHGLALGDWIGYNGSAWVKARAASGSIAADGVVSRVTDSDTFTITFGDAIKLPSHGYTLGPLYLSTTSAGNATSTEPSGAIRQYLGKAISTDYLFLKIGDAILY